MNKTVSIQWSDKAGFSHALYFDAILSETQELTSTVTEHPVEKGADVADHVRVNLDRVAFEAVVSSRKIRAEDNFGGNANGGSVRSVKLTLPDRPGIGLPTPGALYGAAVNAIKDAIKGKREGKVSVLQFDREFDSVLEVQNVLRQLINEKQSCEVYTSTLIYKDMILIGAPMNRSPEWGREAATFSIEFKKIRVVETKLVKAPDPSEPRANTKKSKGAKDGATPKVPAQKESLLSKLVGAP